MEKLLTKVLIELLMRPGKEGVLIFKSKEPQPPEVKKNMEKLLNDLRISGLLNDVIGLSVKGKIRRYKEVVLFIY